MLQIQSAIVYYGLLFVMVILGKKAAIMNNWKYCVWAILIYASVLGLRFGVGTDFFTYKEVYEIYLTYGFRAYELYDEFEIGFSALMALMGWAKFPAPLFFGIIAFIQLYFLALIFKDDKKMLPWLFFAFITSGLFLSYANIIRSCIAISIGLYSFKYIVQKKPLIHYGLLLLAASMHLSILVLVIFYPIFRWKQDWLHNRALQFALLVTALVVMKINVIQDVITRIDALSVLFGYDNYLTDDRMDQKVGLGLGFIIELIVSLLIIWQSNDMKKYYKNKYFDIVYSIFIVGLIFHYIFINSMLLMRVVGIAYYSFVIVYAYMLYFLREKKKHLFYVTCSLLLLLLLSPVISDINSANSFVFIWQDDWCRLKDSYLNPMKIFL